MRRLANRVLVLALATALVVVASPCPAGERIPAQWRWHGVDRLVAVGDVHGAYPELVSLLKGTGLVSGDLSWSGGETHLVMLGDVVDRGGQSRAALELIMRLQLEALQAGGRVHMLLGNHEVMNLIGDLRNLGDDELEAYAADEDQQLRERSLEKLLKAAQPAGKKEREARLTELEQAFPPGFYNHRRQFAPDGRYGSWLLSQRILVVINDIAFVHGGLPSCLLDLDPERINDTAMAELTEYLAARQRLTSLGFLGPEMPLAVQWEMIDRLLSKLRSSFGVASRYRRLEGAAMTMKRLAGSLVLRSDGPLWYRGTSLNPVAEEEQIAKRVLDLIGARAVVVGHTPVHTRRVATRLDGRVIQADTGMLRSLYLGRPAAVVLAPIGLFAFYPEEGLSPLPATVLGLGDAQMLADAQVEALLRDAEVVQVEAVGSGATRPQRLVLQHAGQRYRAIFKTIDREVVEPDGTIICDRFRYEAAAYRIDRLLGLGLVPPTVLRFLDGREGSVQLWIEDAISEQARRSEELEPADRDAYVGQLARMNLLDLLIGNADRDETNILVTTRDWTLHLIDHSRAFGLADRAEATFDTGELQLDDELLVRLRALDARTLRHSLGLLLTDAEISALLLRRDRLLAAAE